MNDHNKTFGQFIAEMRLEKRIPCSQLSKSIGISTAYLSQLEHGIRHNPDPKLVMKIAKALNLSNDGSRMLFTLYAEASGQLPPDIIDYLTGDQTVQNALRQARDANATAEDWEHFIEQLKK